MSERGWAAIASLVVWTVAVAGLGPGVLELETDNSPRVFFPRDESLLAEHRRLVESLGDPQVLRVVLRGAAEERGWLTGLEERLAGLDGVSEVVGPSLFASEDLAGEALVSALREDPVAAEIGLVGEGDVLTVLVFLSPGSSERRISERVSFASGEPPVGVETAVVGLPRLNLALDRSSREIATRTFPLLLAVSAAILLGVLRDPRDAAAVLLTVGAVLAVVLGALGRSGITLNLVLVVLPPILFVVTLATAIHLLVRVRDLRSQGGAEEGAVPRALRDKGWAIVWSGVTTMMGFGSLAVAGVGPIRTLGAVAAGGMVVVTAAVITLLPALLTLVKGGRGRGALEERLRGLGRRVAERAGRRRRAVLATAAIVAVACLAAASRIEVESDALRYLPPDHPLRRATEDLAEAGIGTGAVALLLGEEGCPAGERVVGHPDLDAFEARLRRTETVAGVVGPAAVAEAIRRRIPGGLGPIDRDTLLALGAGRDDTGNLVRRFASEDGCVARVGLQVPLLGYRELDRLREAVREAGEEHLPGVRASVTGELVLLLESQRRLLSTFAWSLGLTVATVAAILLLLLRDSRLAGLSLVPNLWPVVGMLGVMGALGVPLDIATVMVAAVVLGLAVDDTLHALGHFRSDRDGSRLGAAVRSLEITAPAYLLTGSVLVAGFGVCGWSSFLPTRRFGLLAAVAIAFAVLGDLVLLPSLLASGGDQGADEEGSPEAGG